MKLAVLSDIHDNIWQLERALATCWAADALLFCGDFCAPFTLKQIADVYPRPVHAVFGNNDGDRFMLASIAAEYPHVHLHGELAVLNFDDLTMAVNHYPEIAFEIASNGRHDVVFYGHNHQQKIERIGRTEFINPGEIMGRFGRSTFAMYDTNARRCEIIEVASP